MPARDPVRKVFIILGVFTMLLVISAGILSNSLFEKQLEKNHQQWLMDNSLLLSSILQRFPQNESQQAILIIKDLIETWNRNTNHRHRVVASTQGGEEFLVFPHNIGILEHTVTVPLKLESGTGEIRLSTTALNPDYPSQIYILVVLGSLIVVAIGTGMLVARRALQEPLNALSIAAGHFAEGDLAYRTSPDTHPVVAHVAQTMNQMAIQLESRIATIVSQQQELETLFSSMIEGIIVLDSKQRIKRINHIAAGFFNIQPVDAIGKPLLQTVRSSMVEALVKETATGPQESEIVFLSGIQKTLQIHATRYDTGSRAGILLVLHDMTAIRRLETVRRDFVANVSHELKTPITSISGFVETILDDPDIPEEKLRNFLGIIRTQSQRLQVIIEDLLSLARIEEHGKELPRTRVSIAELLDSVVELCQSQARASGIVLKTEQGPTDTILANTNLMEQALFNLVQNAIKFSSNNSSVILRSYDTDNAMLCFEVEDHGTGIPGQDLPRLFERFYRVDKARSRGQGGTGLGLAIVRHIALVHKGRVEVQSTLGMGSVFRILIPV